MDEVNVDEFLREASSAIDDRDKLFQYIREKAIIAIERFLVRTDTGVLCKLGGLCLSLFSSLLTELLTKDVHPCGEARTRGRVGS
jgi:hypothetical protein